MHWTGNPSVHFAFEAGGYLAAAILYVVVRQRRGDTIPDSSRAAVLAAAAVGATIGTRLLFWLCDPALTLRSLTNPAYLLGGKTVVGGLLGGLIGVEITKRIIGVRRSTGDLFVLPMIVAMCIGRVGCFLAGPIDHTAGNPTDLPWGIAIADGVRRHPVALYEIAFLLLIAVVMPRVSEGPGGTGDAPPTRPGSSLTLAKAIASGSSWPATSPSAWPSTSSSPSRSRSSSASPRSNGPAPPV